MISPDEVKRVVRNTVPLRVLFALRQFVYDLRAVFFVGNSVFCPVCNQGYRRFLGGGRSFHVLEALNVVGGGFRQQNYCPRCNSGYKERLLYLYLQHCESMFGPRMRELSVLHVAPEWSLRKVFASESFAQYVRCDLNSPLVDLRVDVTAIPFPDQSFDVLICNHVLEHVPDDRTAMKELYRVLRAGGLAVLQVPFTEALDESVERDDAIEMTNSQREMHFGQWDHIRIYSRRDYCERLQRAGFDVEEFYWPASPTFSRMEKCALDSREVVFCARKTEA
jgi:SAM-dependent methyltransferase